jgi:putative ABC transport system permease protein
MMKQAMTNPGLMGELNSKTETELAAMMDAYLENPEEKVLLDIYDTYVSAGTFEENMDRFGVVDYGEPSEINIYVDSFEAKDAISECIRRYNEGVSKEDRIVYTDAIALLMSSITTIVDVISYVLIAFVSVSLVVSSIMIGIITYISVLERTKEIGILRAIGASKKNISQVFNAETFIIGLCSGLLGVGVTLLLHIPVNAIIHALSDINDVNAVLPVGAAVILVILSVILTLIGGLIPSRLAAKKDPVIALRSE